MELSLYDRNVFESYKSNSQRIRVLSENWFSQEMYCPSCLNPRISQHPNNEKVYDFLCEKCRSEYQLKSSSKKFGKKVSMGNTRP